MALPVHDVHWETENVAQRADAVAATACQPASRDDRETPLVAGGMGKIYGISEFL